MQDSFLDMRREPRILSRFHRFVVVLMGRLGTFNALLVVCDGALLIRFGLLLRVGFRCGFPFGGKGLLCMEFRQILT